MAAPRWPGAPPRALTVFAAVFLIHGLFLLVRGAPIWSPDGINYGLFADRLIATGFDYGAVAGEADWLPYPVPLYGLFVTFVALLKFVAGGQWGALLVAVNLAAEAGTAALLVRLSGRLGGAVAGWAALLLFLACFEATAWTPFPMSDATFLFLSFALYAAAAQRLLSGEGRIWPLVAAALVLAFWRPAAVLLVPAMLWCAFLGRANGSLRVRNLALGALAALGIAGALLFVWILADPARWPWQALSGAVAETAGFYAQGEVVNARPDTWHAPPVGLVDYALIAADRFVHFFHFMAPDYGWLRIAVQLAFFLPVYLLGGWLLLALLRGRTGLTRREADMLFASLGIVLAFAAFHGLLQIDNDWRYRLPILPHLALFAAVGAGLIARRRGWE